MQMIKKLKKYRKSKGFTKKEMAKKLKISKEEYKKLVNDKDYEIDSKLEKRIEKLLSSEKPKYKAKGIEIPKGLESTIKIAEKLNRITSPTAKLMDSITTPYKSSLAITEAALKMTESIQPKLNTWADFTFPMPDTTPEIVKFTNKFTDSIPYVELNNVTEAFQGVLDNDSISSLQNSITTVNNIGKTLNDYISIPDYVNSPILSLSETINKNSELYTEYIDFSSSLAEALAPIIDNSKLYFPEEFYDATKLNTIDFLSGSTFLAFEHYQNFDEEKEVLEKIKEDSKLQHEAIGFFEELHEVIGEDNDEYDSEEFISLVNKFAIWISNTFDKSFEKALMLGKTILLNSQLLTFIFMATLAIDSRNASAARDAKILHNQEQSLRNDKQSLENQEKSLQNQEAIIKNQQEILKRKSDELMQLMTNTKLRISNNGKSKILGSIKKGQIVEVEEKKIKWMRVSLKDIDTDEPKTGWVRIELFKEIETN